MRRAWLVALCFGLWSLLAAPFALANGVYQSVTGDVRAAAGTAAPASVAANQRVLPGTTITTGPGAQTVIRFDDGHTVILNENTEFRVNQYSFDRDRPQSDSIAMQIVKGALRSVSGLIGSRNGNAFALIAPQATIGIRGTDFMIALVNPAFIAVTQGVIGVANAAGTVAFAAGSTVSVASATALAGAISAAALPASVAASFSSMGSVAVSAVGAGATGAGTGAGGAGAGGAGAAGAGAGAGAAVGAGVGGITAGVVAASVAIGATAAAAASSSSDNASFTSGTSGTTGTGAAHP